MDEGASALDIKLIDGEGAQHELDQMEHTDAQVWGDQYKSTAEMTIQVMAASVSANGPEGVHRQDMMLKNLEEENEASAVMGGRNLILESIDNPIVGIKRVNSVSQDHSSGDSLVNIDIEATSEDLENGGEGSEVKYEAEEDSIPAKGSSIRQMHMKRAEYMFSVRGWDNFHIYLWILKDLAWTLDNFWMSAVCGSMAVAWCGILVAVAYKNKDWEEIYMLVSTILWIVGNFWWMAAETSIVGDDDTNALQTSYMLETGLAWLLLFYLALRPLEVIKETPSVTQQFLVLDLHPRFSYFKNWRQYEYLHMLFWISKDLSWNRLCRPTWWMSLILTITVGVEFIWVSFKKGYVVDVAHYTAQLLWVFANGAWAYGELYTDLDDPYPVGDRNATSLMTGRWWASVLLVIAFIPILLLYFLWFPYMYLQIYLVKDGESPPTVEPPTLGAVFFYPRASLDKIEDTPAFTTTVRSI